MFYKTIPHIFKGESLLGVFGIEDVLRLSTHSMRDLQSNDYVLFFFLGTSTFFVPVNTVSFCFLSFLFLKIWLTGKGKRKYDQISFLGTLSGN